MSINPYAMLAHAPQLKLQFRRLPDDEMARWVPERNTIILDDRLTQAERRCSLMHELIHRLHQDATALPPRLAARQERECERRTAQLLIPLNRLVEALQWSYNENMEEIAEQLWVDTGTLDDRIRTLTDHERGFIIKRLRRRDDREDVA